MEKQELFDQLPEPVRDWFLDITDYRVLGASKHIHLIGCIFTGIAEQFEAHGKPLADAVVLISQTGRFFQETRGDASRAVYNAVGELLRLIRAIGPESDNYAACIRKAVECYDQKSRENQQLIAGYAAGLVAGMRGVLVYDYSSTVAAFLRQLGKNSPGTLVLIPESRVINGGAEFVNVSIESGLTVHFIPDAALLYYLPQCDAAFIGAETFFPDGTAFNTTGSDLAALACEALSIPYYVLTPLNKVDFRAAYGHQKPPVMRDLRELLTPCLKGIKPDCQIDFSCPELLAIPPRRITAYVTEAGIVPVSALFKVSQDYINTLEGTFDDTVEP